MPVLLGPRTLARTVPPKLTTLAWSHSRRWIAQSREHLPRSIEQQLTGKVTKRVTLFLRQVDLAKQCVLGLGEPVSFRACRTDQSKATEYSVLC